MSFIMTGGAVGPEEIAFSGDGDGARPPPPA